MQIPIISLPELQQLMQSNQKFLLIDVREPWELQTYGALPGAKNIPMHELPMAIALSPKTFTKKYGFSWNKTDKAILYCRSGSRSNRATGYAISHGYNAVNFKGSILAWATIDPKVKAY